MNRMLLLAVAPFAVLAADVRADVQAEEWTALKERVGHLEAGASNRAMTAEGLASKLKVDGFMSAGFGMSMEDDFIYEGNEETGSFDADGVAGLQLEGKLSNNTRTVLQLVGRSNDGDFNVKTEWAYIGYKPTNNGELRVGLQRFPFFLMSEYIDVGYAYPWIKPPAEVYLPGMPSSYNGVSWHQAINAGDWAHTLMGYWGNDRFESAGGTFLLENSVGLVWTGSAGDWQFGLNLSRGDSTFSGGLFDTLAAVGVIKPLEDARGGYGGVSLQYDDGRWLVMAEATEIRVEGYFADTAQEYLTVGYRFGKILPTITYGASRITDSADRANSLILPTLCTGPGTLCLDQAGTVPMPPDTLARLLENVQDSLSLGVRVDFTANAAFKVDWTHVLDTHGTFGYFERNDGNIFYGALPGDGGNVLRVAVDAVF